MMLTCQKDELSQPPVKGLKNKPMNVVEENYTRFYYVDEKNHLDCYVDKHYNGLYLIGLAPSHPVRRLPCKIMRVDFEINKRSVDDFQVSGKKKAKAVKVQSDTKLCRIDVQLQSNSTNDNHNANTPTTAEPQQCASFLCCAGLTGKVIEINTRLMQSPSVLEENADVDGYVAMIERFDSAKIRGQKNKPGQFRRQKNAQLVEEALLDADQYAEYLRKYNFQPISPSNCYLSTY
mmetsp:Transcript_22090/g.35462  ORF Transcript_22090/g.35462 Transcript_22090/m.35462 type:complete len:234 (-) Transcript_22090:33-734(-)